MHLTDIVCCCLIRDDDWADLELAYWHHPWSDSRRKLPARLDDLGDWIAEGIELHERRFMIYCDSGRNRSNLLAAMVVRRILAVTGKEAVEIVRQGRPMALKNPLFVSYLESL